MEREKAAALNPKFGDWDDNSPAASNDEFTQWYLQLHKVRDEKPIVQTCASHDELTQSQLLHKLSGTKRKENPSNAKTSEEREKAATLNPKFGGWDEKYPVSDAEFTQRSLPFHKVKDESHDELTEYQPSHKLSGTKRKGIPGSAKSSEWFSFEDFGTLKAYNKILSGNEEENDIGPVGNVIYYGGKIGESPPRTPPVESNNPTSPRQADPGSPSKRIGCFTWRTRKEKGLRK